MSTVLSVLTEKVLLQKRSFEFTAVILGPSQVVAKYKVATLVAGIFSFIFI